MNDPNRPGWVKSTIAHSSASRFSTGVPVNAAGSVVVAAWGMGLAILFVGIAAGAIDERLVLPEVLTAFGLTIFVYTIGLSSGPGFVSAKSTIRGRMSFAIRNQLESELDEVFRQARRRVDRKMRRHGEEAYAEGLPVSRRFTLDQLLEETDA